MAGYFFCLFVVPQSVCVCVYNVGFCVVSLQKFAFKCVRHTFRIAEIKKEKRKEEKKGESEKRLKIWRSNASILGNELPFFPSLAGTNKILNK